MFIDTATNRTGTRGVSGINQDHRHTCPLCLVIDKLTELVKRPVRVSRPLLGSNRCPVTDALEILKSNPASGVLRLLHDMLADNVVGVLLETSLTARQLAELTLCSLRAFALQISAAVRILAAAVFDRPAAKILAVAVRGQVYNSQVNAQEIINVLFGWRLHVAGSEQVELSVDQTQVTFPALAGEQFPVACTTNKWDNLPSLECPDRDIGLFKAVRQDAVIEGDCAVRPKGALRLSVKFVRIGHFGDTAHNYLRGKEELITNIMVNEFMQWKLTEGFAIPCLIGNVIAGSIRYFQRLPEIGGLFWRGKKFDFRRQFHVLSIAQMSDCFNILRLKPLKRGASSQGCKPWVSAPKGRLP